MSDFGKALQELNEEYEAKGVNSATRVKWMLTSALMHLDTYKIVNHPGRTALTEKEFLDMVKRSYWETRTSLQAEPAAEVPTTPVRLLDTRNHKT